MKVTARNPADPAASLKMVDAYLRWALLAAEEVVGKQGINVVLREAGLARAINNLPPNELKAGVVQTACRALGAEACVWEVSKTPKE
jgi:hypothetical protein